MQINAGTWHTCAITRTAQAYCWGDNSSGQLGIGSSPTQSAAPVYLAYLRSNARWVDGGNKHTCFLLGADLGTLCTGDNYFGQRGDGTTEPSVYGEQVAWP